MVFKGEVRLKCEKDNFWDYKLLNLLLINSEETKSQI